MRACPERKSKELEKSGQILPLARTFLQKKEEGRFKLKELLIFCVHRLSLTYFKGAVALKYSFEAIKYQS